MKEINQIIKNIQSGNCTENEIEKYLDVNSLYVLSNAMFFVVKKAFNSPEIIKKLIYWSNFRDLDKYKLMGIDTIGLLAIATLIKIGVRKEDINAYKELDDILKNRVDVLVKEAFD